MPPRHLATPRNEDSDSGGVRRRPPPIWSIIPSSGHPHIPSATGVDSPLAAQLHSKHDPPIVLAKVDANDEKKKPLAAKDEFQGFPTLEEHSAIQGPQGGRGDRRLHEEAGRLVLLPRRSRHQKMQRTLKMGRSTFIREAIG